MSAQDQRPRFYEGQTLGAADLEAVVGHAGVHDARHLLGGHAWGIASGLQLVERRAEAGGDEVDVFIEPGVAVDGFGRSIVLTAPQPVPASKFAGFIYDATLDADGKGRLVAVWLRYAETLSAAPRAGFGACLSGDTRARVQEGFEIVVGMRGREEQHAAVTVAGSGLRVAPDAARVHPGSRVFYDESVPHQTFPDPPFDHWLIPLGFVRWLPVNGGPGHFVRRDDSDAANRDRDRNRRFRRYVGVVAEEILAADQALRVRDRSRPPSPTFVYPAAADPAETDPALLPASDLLFVEGATRVEGDLRLVGGALDLLSADGTDRGTPMRLTRAERPLIGGGSRPALEARIGTAAQSGRRFAVGPVDDGGKLVEKLSVLAEGNVGIGEAAPTERLHVVGNRILLEQGTKRIALRTDGASVGLQSDTDSLYLRASGAAGKNDIVMNHGDHDGNVGIGVESPSHKLHVDSVTGLRQNALYLSGDVESACLAYNAHRNAADSAFELPDAAHKAIRLDLHEQHGVPQLEVLSCFSGNPLQWRSHLRVDGKSGHVVLSPDAGRVGIGTRAPVGKLSVESEQANQGRISLFTAEADFVYDGGSDGRFVFQDNGGTTIFQGGAIGINETAPQARLHVSAGPVGDSANLNAHVAIVENTSTATTANVLALRVGAAAPKNTNNFITFFRGDTPIGSIEAATANSVVLRTAGADFAECLDHAEAAAEFEAGDVVGIHEGRASLRTAGAQFVSAITARAAVLGNHRSEAGAAQAPVAFVGQVAVKVRGPVRAGDWIAPSGLADGTGIAVPGGSLASDPPAQLLGQAWSSSDDPGVKRVNVAIGLGGAAPLAALLREIDTLRGELRALRESR